MVRIGDRGVLVTVAQQAGLASATAELVAERLLELQNLKIPAPYHAKMVELQLLLVEPQFADALGELKISIVTAGGVSKQYTRTGRAPLAP